MSKKILELKNITYSYDGEENVLEDVSVSISQGEKIAVLGINGSGKSTFFLCCNKVMEPQQGEIFLRGKRITNNKKDLIALRSTVGIVFQDPNQQFIGTTVFDDISFGALNIGLNKTGAEKRVNQVLEDMNLQTLSKRPPHYLSGGEKKRLSIADVLVMHPDIILFDEPTAFLDSYNISLFEESLKRLHGENKAIVISTHDIDFAFSWADRVIIFSNGKIISDGKTDNLLTDIAVLNSANLKPPFLYNVTNILKEQGLLQENSEYPKTVADLELLLKRKPTNNSK